MYGTKDFRNFSVLFCSSGVRLFCHRSILTTELKSATSDKTAQCDHFDIDVPETETFALRSRQLTWFSHSLSHSSHGGQRKHLLSNVTYQREWQPMIEMSHRQQCSGTIAPHSITRTVGQRAQTTRKRWQGRIPTSKTGKDSTPTLIRKKKRQKRRTVNLNNRTCSTYFHPQVKMLWFLKIIFHSYRISNNNKRTQSRYYSPRDLS